MEGYFYWKYKEGVNDGIFKQKEGSLKIEGS